VVLNAKQYKIDGFRFDLMSFLFVSNMQQIQMRWRNSRWKKMAWTAARFILRRGF